MADENQEKPVDRKAAKEAAKQAKKEAKQAVKEAKKAAREQIANAEDVFDDESSGSKVAVVFVTIIIILVWLAVLALIIKSDVGGFGSKVARPILKNVPVINKILPSNSEYEFSDVSDDNAGYSSLDEAISRIKELENELQSAKNKNKKNKDQISELKKEVKRLKGFEEEYAEFEKIKEEFYEEVVFSENSPDINEYQKYYEAIDPTNAELLYKQVLKQEKQDEELKDYVKMYSSMKPKEAAAIFDTMTDDLKLVAKIIKNMDADTSSAILGKMNTETAARITEILEP